MAAGSHSESTSGMSGLIPVVNKLQDVFGALGGDGIDLPQIVVVGSQSSGKSSVLENIVGRDFLPRGSGIVTRRPLVLQLNAVDAQEGEWGEFLHRKGKRFTDFGAIRAEIAAETARVAGSNTGISPSPIHLRIYSPHVLPLTLVDLPGMTKVPVGDQPRNIEQVIRDLVFQFIEPENAIILAVTAANTDLANSDALNVAREVDPNGKRTLGVLTKLDLMDAGTNAAAILEGKVLPLRLGYIAVVNRSQADIEAEKSIGAALDAEAAFFQNHPAYSKLAQRCGTTYLARTLNSLLLSHIKKTLPELRESISRQMALTNKELDECGVALLDSPAQRSAGLLQALTKYCNEFVAAIEGKARDFSVTSYQGGARISYILHNTFAESVNHANALEGLDPNDIRTAISNATGAQRAIFVPEASFELLVRRQIAKLRFPATQCAEFVLDELETIAVNVAATELARFDLLRERVVETVLDLLRASLAATTELINTLVEMELSYINTSHPDFHAQAALMGLRGDTQGEAAGAGKEPVSMPEKGKEAAGGFLSNFFGGRKEEAARDPTSPKGAKDAPHTAWSLMKPPSVLQPDAPLTDQERMSTQLVKSLLECYFDIVKKNIADSVPKAIMLKMVRASMDNIQSELFGALYREELFDVLMVEADGIAETRRRCRADLEQLKAASAVLAEVRDTHL